MNVYRKAIERLDKFGWIKDSFGNPVTAACLVGTLNMVRHRMMTFQAAPNDFIELIEVIKEQYEDADDRFGPDDDLLINFNDSMETTIEVVKAMLEKAAIKLEEKVSS